MLTLSIALPAQAQTTADSGSVGGGTGRILLVLPFDNRTSQPNLEWIREAAPTLLSSRFASVGFAPMSREDRTYALDHLGLPQGFHPSRASSLKLAETLDADSIVVGSYVTDGAGIVAEARLVDVPHLRMSEAVTARGEMRNLIAVFDSLAWKLTRQLDPGFKGSEETFVAAGSTLSLAAFEQYIRGITESDQQERLRHLNQAVHLSPELSPAWIALGREEYNGQQYPEAAAAFAKVSGSGSDAHSPEALKAGFYGGLAQIFSGDYGKAEASFASVARVLPLAEVVNNQGVAVSRQGHDASALFRQAVAADPNEADYHFNLAVSLHRHGNVADARSELSQCIKLRPNDAEAEALATAWNPTAKQQAAGATPAAAEKADPLERIARNFDEVAFHQAAQMLDQVDATRLAALTPRQRALKLAGQAKDYLDLGLLLEAERLYLSAVVSDGKVAEAHTGLAQVRELTGNNDAARKEAQISVDLAPSAAAYLVLGRLDLAAGRLYEAHRNLDQAVALEPQSAAATELRQKIQSREVTNDPAIK